MRRVLLPAVAAVAVTATGVAVHQGRSEAADSARPAAVATAAVEQGPLAAIVEQTGTLTHRAGPDGTPYTAVNPADGVFTQLPAAGTAVDCGGVLYRVDDVPVLLLCGGVPAYRDLRAGDEGPDVRQLNATLHRLRLDRAHGIRSDERRFTARTAAALRALQRDRGLPATGTLDREAALFLPGPVRIAQVTAELGGPARPGTPALTATSDVLHVEVTLDPAQQEDVATGDPARIVLPGHRIVSGKVAGFGRTAQAPDGGSPTAATVPTFVDLDDAGDARGLDRAPVQVQITTAGATDALSVPVTAILGRPGGFAVERVRGGGVRELVPVELGLFDTAAGRVQVEGGVRAGDRVVVPAS